MRAISGIVAVVVGLISTVQTISTSRGGLLKKRNHWKWFCCNDVASNVGLACTFEVVALFAHRRVWGNQNIHSIASQADCFCALKVFGFGSHGCNLEGIGLALFIYSSS